MDHIETDLAVIGSGPAGQSIAHGARGLGMAVTLVEKDRVGGTCPIRGCDPKHLLWDVASCRRQAERLAEDGLSGGDEPVFDWPAAIARTDRMAGEVSAGAEEKLAEAGIRLLHGEATFQDAHHLAVGGHDLHAERVVLACGARPRPLDEIPGGELAVTSRTLLAMRVLPADAVCIGSGYVGMEFAHFLAATGLPVKMVCPRERPLRGFDPVLVDRLVDDQQQRGIELVCGHRAMAIRGENERTGRYLVELDDGSCIDTGLVVHAAGRRGNGDLVAAPEAGLELDDGGCVVIDQYCRARGADHIWAVGDCGGCERPPLTPVANHDAAVVLAQLRGEKPSTPVPRRQVPSICFTMPPLCRVGEPIDEVAERPGVEIVERDLAGISHMKRLRENVAGVRLAIDCDRDRLLGAHLLGPGMDELINVFALAIQQDLPLAGLRALVPAYPTLGALVPSWL